MRPSAWLLSLAVLAGCAVSEECRDEVRRDGAFADAAWEVGAPAPVPIALDPVVAELVRAAVSAHDHRRRVVLENLANVDTPGYKRRVARTTVQQIAGGDGQVFSIPVVAGTDTVFTTGALECSERSLDVAIDGNGFFAVCLLDGATGYTRDGRLHVDVGGRIVTGDNRVLLPEITLPNDVLEVSIEPEGRFAGRTAGSPDTATRFGQITLHRFANPAGLRCEGTCWRPTDESGAPMTATPGTMGLGTLKQGFVERSNVHAKNELFDLQVLERQHRTLVQVLQQFGMIAP